MLIILGNILNKIFNVEIKIIAHKRNIFIILYYHAFYKHNPIKICIMHA